VALVRVKGGVSSDQGGKAHGIDVRCETALSEKPEGLPPQGGAALQRPPKEDISDRVKARLFTRHVGNGLDPRSDEGCGEGDEMFLVKSRTDEKRSSG
jgi:hypothetical protein